MDKQILKIIGIFLAIVILVLLITRKTPEKNMVILTPTPKPEIKLAKPGMLIDTSKKYSAILTTSDGSIKIELNASETPITVNNFVFLAKNHFYDNTIFHRVIRDFMIQGGDPKGDGTGGPGYQFDDEQFTGEYEKGTVAMANAGSNTNGSQFFIMLEKNNLPKNYVIFGKVVSGIDAVEKIGTSQVEPSSSGEMSKPVSPVVVKSINVQEK